MITSAAALADPGTDTRQLVKFPPQMEQKFLFRMRDHFVALDGIIAALGEENFEKAATVAESGLNMGSGKGGRKAGSHECEHDGESPGSHQGHEHEAGGHEQGKGFGKYMPREMKRMGLAMHEAAGEFARVAREGDAKTAFQALHRVTSSCIACHASYRVERVE